MSVCKIIILGRLGKDPVLKETQTGKKVCNFSVATGKDADTLWHVCEAWNRNAEICHEHLGKGRQVLVEGTLKKLSYTNANGVKIESYRVLVLSIGLIDHNRSQAKSELQEKIPDDVMHKFYSDAKMDEIPF